MKRYDKEFKEQALRLSDDIGVKKVSEQLGIVYGTLTDWRKQRVRNNRALENTNGNKADEEITRLRKEVAQLKNANAILKDALGFFVEDRNR